MPSPLALIEALSSPLKSLTVAVNLTSLLVKSAAATPDKDIFIRYPARAPFVHLLNDKNEFVHVLSAADLRGLNKDTFDLLLLNILEFLDKVKKSAPHTAFTSTTLSEVMNYSVQNLSHRAFILEDGKVLNVISLTDIIKLYLANE